MSWRSLVANASWQRRQQEQAWAFGREQCDRLLSNYQTDYGLAPPPPPAKIIDELLTDYLKAALQFDPLPLDRYGETRLEDGKAVVTINSRLGDIEGVKDAQGVENVAKWHEAMHVIRDLDTLVAPASRMFDGFDQPAQIVCYRAAGAKVLTRRDESVEREFWAEEAGRAAAVSLKALQRAESFRALLRAAGRSTGAVVGAWPLLYDAATEIGVNITALVKQLSLEGCIVVDREGGRSVVHVQSVLIGGVS
jgi:hypothetical protein